MSTTAHLAQEEALLLEWGQGYHLTFGNRKKFIIGGYPTGMILIKAVESHFVQTPKHGAHLIINIYKIIMIFPTAVEMLLLFAFREMHMSKVSCLHLTEHC